MNDICILINENSSEIIEYKLPINNIIHNDLKLDDNINLTDYSIHKSKFDVFNLNYPENSVCSNCKINKSHIVIFDKLENNIMHIHPYLCLDCLINLNLYKCPVCHSYEVNFFTQDCSISSYLFEIEQKSKTFFEILTKISDKFNAFFRFENLIPDMKINKILYNKLLKKESQKIKDALLNTLNESINKSEKLESFENLKENHDYGVTSCIFYTEYFKPDMESKILENNDFLLKYTEMIYKENNDDTYYNRVREEILQSLVNEFQNKIKRSNSIEEVKSIILEDIIGYDCWKIYNIDLLVHEFIQLIFD